MNGTPSKEGAGAPAYKDRTPQGEFDVPYAATGSVYAYAMVLNRYRERYRLTPEQLAKVAVDARFNARHNPNAIHRGTSRYGPFSINFRTRWTRSASDSRSSQRIPRLE